MTATESRRNCVLLLLRKHPGQSAAAVGDWLARHKLLSRTTGMPSNWCLAGAAVLRGMTAKGWIGSYMSGTDRWAVRKFILTAEGQKAANELIEREAN